MLDLKKNTYGTHGNRSKIWLQPNVHIFWQLDNFKSWILKLKIEVIPLQPPKLRHFNSTITIFKFPKWINESERMILVVIVEACGR